MTKLVFKFSDCKSFDEIEKELHDYVNKIMWLEQLGAIKNRTTIKLLKQLEDEAENAINELLD